MHPGLEELSAQLPRTGDLAADVAGFLRAAGRPKTAGHCADVAAEAARLARLHGEDPAAAAAAGWLHDVSDVFPVAERLAAAREFGLEVLPEEEAFPLIIHQKLSVVLARELFGVTDPGVLSAVGCHTTLKAGASRLDKVLFVADKLAWDQWETQGAPPFREQVLAGLDRSLDAGALAYMEFMWERRDSLRVVHPWLAEAYRELAGV